MTEEITFKSDGQLSYKMDLDLTELIKMSSDAADEFSEKKDTIISFTDLINKERAEEGFTEEQEQMLDDLKPLKFKYSPGQNGQKSMLSIFGDFKSSTNLNQAFATLAKSGKSKDNDDQDHHGRCLLGDPPVEDLFKNPIQYSWDGKVLKIVRAAAAQDDDSTDSSDMFGMLSSGSVKVSYTFPRKVKTVSDPSATFSQDGKSIYFNYSMAEYYNTSKAKELTIEIE